MAAGLKVCCSILEGSVKSLKESPVKQLQGNELPPGFQFVAVSCTVGMPKFNNGGYAASLSSVKDKTLQSIRRFHTKTTFFDLPIYLPGASRFQRTYSSEISYQYSPLETLQPTGNERTFTYDSDGNYNGDSTETYFDKYETYFNYWGKTYTEYTINYTLGYPDPDTGLYDRSGSVTVSNEFDYSGHNSYLRDRINTFDAAGFAALWSTTLPFYPYPGISKSLSPIQSQVGDMARGQYSGGQTSPSNIYTGYGHTEVESTSFSGKFDGINFALTVSALQSSYSGIGGESTASKGQLKYIGGRPLNYFLIETLRQGSSGITWPAFPYKVLSSGTMYTNDIIDIPIPSFTAPFMSSNFGGMPVYGMEVRFVVGDPGPITFPGGYVGSQISSW
jgi:hypothetical protein